MHVKYGSQEVKLVLVVIQGDRPTLLGHNWLKYTKLNWNKIAVIYSTKPELWQGLSQKHEALFQDDLGTASSYQATLNLMGLKSLLLMHQEHCPLVKGTTHR